MIIIASIESLLGSLWFAGLCFLIGLVLGHCGILGWLMNRLKK